MTDHQPTPDANGDRKDTAGPSGSAKAPATPASQPPAHHAPAHQAHPHYSAPKYPEAKIIATLSDGLRIKERVPRMRACDEKDEKGEICAGHLKRWFNYVPLIGTQYGNEIYRCERCHTIYLPNPSETPRTGTLAW